MDKFYSCAVVSQRPTQFKFKYQEYMTSCKRLKKRLHDVFMELYRRGVRRYYVGGALGVDLWAGEILGNAMAERMPGIENCACVSLSRS